MARSLRIAFVALVALLAVHVASAADECPITTEQAQSIDYSTIKSSCVRAAERGGALGCPLGSATLDFAELGARREEGIARPGACALPLGRPSVGESCLRRALATRLSVGHGKMDGFAGFEQCARRDRIASSSRRNQQAAARRPGPAWAERRGARGSEAAGPGP